MTKPKYPGSIDLARLAPGKVNTKPSKRRGLPEHVLRLMAKPDTEVWEYRNALDPGSGEPTSIQVEMPTEPHFICSICKETWKLSVLKHHRPTNLEPEIQVCYFCYKDHDLSSTSPKPKTLQGRQERPPRGSTLDERIFIAASFLKATFPSEQQSTVIDAYIEENSPLFHGMAYIEKFFDRKGYFFDPDGLRKDFIMFASFHHGSSPGNASGSCRPVPSKVRIIDIEEVLR